MSTDPYARLLTAAEAVATIPGIRSEAAVRKWVQRGRLTPVSRDPRTGAAWYLEADLFRAERGARTRQAAA